MDMMMLLYVLSGSIGPIVLYLISINITNIICKFCRKFFKTNFVWLYYTNKTNFLQEPSYVRFCIIDPDGSIKFNFWIFSKLFTLYDDCNHFGYGDNKKKLKEDLKNKEIDYAYFALRSMNVN